MTEPPVVALAVTGLRRSRRNHSLLLMGVVGPLLLGGVLAVAFGGDGPSLQVGIADLDRSPVSREITDGLSTSLEGTGLTMKAVAEGAERPRNAIEQAVRDGDPSAVLVVPEGYAASLATTPLPLEVMASGENPFAAGVAESIGASVAGQVDLQRAVTVAMASAGLTPPAQGVEPVIGFEMVDFSEDFDVQFYFGPLSVFLFLALGTVARSLLRDEQDGMLDRIRASPVSTSQVIGGSAVGVVVQGTMAAVAVVALSSVFFGAVWGQPVEVAAVLAAFVLAVAGLLGVVVGVARTEAQAESWTNVVAFTFAIIGGAFFGGSTLPGVLGRIGTLTPNGAAMRALIELGPGERSLAGVWPYLAWLLLIGVAGLVTGAYLLNRRLR